MNPTNKIIELNDEDLDCINGGFEPDVKVKTVDSKAVQEFEKSLINKEKGGKGLEYFDYILQQPEDVSI